MHREKAHRTHQEGSYLQVKESGPTRTYSDDNLDLGLSSSRTVNIQIFVVQVTLLPEAMGSSAVSGQRTSDTLT